MLPTKTAKKSSRVIAAAAGDRALKLEGDGDEDDDKGYDVDVLPQRRDALRDRDEARMKPHRVGDDERRQAEKRVRHDVKGHQQAIVPPHHRSGSFTMASISSPNRARLNLSA